MAIKMKHKKRGSAGSLLLMLIALLAVVAAIIFWPVEVEAKGMSPASSQDDIEQTTLVKVGDTAPDFTVEMLNGRQLSLSTLTKQGNVVMVMFWATWCPPCREELSHLQRDVLDAFAGRNLVVLPISRGEKPEVVRSFIEKTGYTFPIGLDPERAIYDKYASNYVPRTFIVDTTGKVCYLAVGYDKKVAKEVEDVLNKTLEPREKRK